MSTKKEVADGLCKLLADTYTLYLKTQNFHWNVTGPNFYSLHLLFEQQYQDLANAADEIAERIRALGFPAPASYTQYSKLTSIKEALQPPTANEMIKQLANDQEVLMQTIRGIFKHAEEMQDEATVDLLTERSHVHEKNAWMLNSQIA